MRGRIFIGRQPILDRRERVVAYELLYRDSAESQAAVISDRVAASARTMADTFAALGPDALLGPYTGFLNVDRDTLVSGVVEALPRDRVSVEILEDVEADEEIVRICERLEADGFSLALDDYVEDDPRDALFPYVEFIKVDVMAVPDARLPQLVRRLRRTSASLIAEKVETREEFERCRDLGFDRFQGYYFARPVVISRTRVDPARATLIQLIQQIGADVDTDELCDTIKRSPEVGLNVLRLVNSAALARRTKISTVLGAVQMLGRRHLQRWLTVLLYAGQDSAGLRSPLLQTAARRGRLMELLLRESPRASGAGGEDRAFLAGMASMLDALLSLPIEEVAQQLRLDDAIRDALVTRAGALGDLLRIAEGLERGDFSAVAKLVADFGVSAEQTARAELEAFRWAEDLGSDD